MNTNAKYLAGSVFSFRFVRCNDIPEPKAD